MANEKRLRIPFLSGVILNDPLSALATIIEVEADARLTAITSENYLPIVLDPYASGGAPEIAHAIAYSDSNPYLLTVIREREGSTAREHFTGTQYLHGPTIADFYPNPTPAAWVTRAAALSLTSTSTAIVWDTVRDDPYSFWSAGLPTRLTVPEGLGGLYIVTANAGFSSSSSSLRVIPTIHHNGVAIPFYSYGVKTSTSTFGGAASTVLPLRLTAGDYVENWASTNSTTAAELPFCLLNVVRIGP